MDTHVIGNIIEHCAAVKEFHIRRTDGAPLPAWLPGAHLVLHFSSRQDRLFANRYALIGAAGPADTYRIAVQRAAHGNGGSMHLHDHIRIGSPISISGPFNNFHLAATPSPLSLLIADGIGIASMLSVANALHTRGMPFLLHYMVHDAAHLALRDDLRALPHLVFHFHGAPQPACIDLDRIVVPYGQHNILYASGAQPFLQQVAAAGNRLGWPATAMHFENYGPL